MYNETLFHGSNRDRGEKFISNQKMEPSSGDNHWLGDGSYFFIEDFYSYKWILDMFKKRYSGDPTYEKLSENYMIIIGEVYLQKDRVFDLTKGEHKILYDKVYKELDTKNDIPQDDIAEGVVINYMFNILNYSDLFDVVKALFINNKNKYKGVKTRIGYMPQEQVCIKKLNVVQNIKEYDFKERIDTYRILISDMYFDNIKPEKEVYKGRKTYYFNSKKKISK